KRSRFKLLPGHKAVGIQPFVTPSTLRDAGEPWKQQQRTVRSEAQKRRGELGRMTEPRVGAVAETSSASVPSYVIVGLNCLAGCSTQRGESERDSLSPSASEAVAEIF